jgi:hypothetical protein
MPDVKDFRRIALGLDGALESAHMGHPDFRANGKIFATLHHDMLWGMVKLTPDQQQRFMGEDPESFKPEAGAWGRGGSTAVQLATVDDDTLGEALTLAWQNSARTSRTVGTCRTPATTGTAKKRKRR